MIRIDRKRTLALLLGVFTAMLLTGCTLQDSDSLLAVPALPTKYSALENAIHKLDPDAVPASPQAGTRRQPVQLVDLDADGVAEAVICLMDRNGLSRVLVLRQEEDAYVLQTEISGYSPNIYRIEYPIIDGAGNRAVAVTWGSVSDSQRGMTLVLPRAQKISNLTCEEHLICDTDGDGCDELWAVVKRQFSEELVLCRYEYFGDVLQQSGRLILRDETGHALKIQTSLLPNGSHGIFLDCLSTDSTIFTSVIMIREDGLLEEITGQIRHTERFRKIYCTDLDGDGILEIPVSPRSYPRFLPMWNHIVCWRNMMKENPLTELPPQTFCSPEDGLVITIPDQWKDGMVITRWRDRGSVVFSFYEPDLTWEDEVEESMDNQLILRLVIGEIPAKAQQTNWKTVIMNDHVVSYWMPDWLDPASVNDIEHAIDTLQILQMYD